MFQSKKKNFILWGLIIALTIGCLGVVFFIQKEIFGSRFKSSLPVDFLIAYQNVIRSSQEIVKSASQTNSAIKEINIADLNADSEKALVLINQARQTNDQSYHLAFELSQQLQKMAEALSLLKTPETQRLGYEAVALEFSLVSEFISYTQALNNFLGYLHRAVTVNNFWNRHQVSEAIRTVNQKVFLINNINKEFLLKVMTLNKSLD